ncbi:MAG: hypothetical protein IKT30_07880, partial [Bacteroidaceae bacterium]|nr:hypothetical protein [Bacteroidaceae bacterium]
MPEFSFAFFVVAAGIGIAPAFMEQSVIIVDFPALACAVFVNEFFDKNFLNGCVDFLSFYGEI